MKQFFWILSFLLAFAACTKDPDATKMLYMPDMVDGPTVKAQRNYVDPPPGSVPHDAYIYPDNIDEAEKLLTNPLKDKPGEDWHMARGEHLFNVNCAVCHGDGIKGDGHLTDVFPKPPDLTLPMYKERGDGFYFYTMTFGSRSGLMSGYGHATSRAERWEILLYVRSLQNKQN